MKTFLKTPFGKRLIVTLLMLAVAVGIGVLFRTYSVPEAGAWQFCVYCVASFGTGLAALGFFPGGWRELPGGYAAALLCGLLRLLPRAWSPGRRLLAFVCLALLLLVAPALLRLRKSTRKDESVEVQEPEEAEDTTEPQPSGDMLLVHFFISDRNYQLIRTPGELRAYRVGGEFRGVDKALLQDPKKPLRPLGKKDLSFPLDETFSVSFQERYNTQWDRDEVVVTLRSGRRKHRMNALGSDEQVRAFFAQCTANRTEQRSRLPKEPDVAPDPKRVALLRKVSTGLLVATLLIDLPWLLLPLPNEILAVPVMLLPFVSVALYCIFPHDTTISDRKRDELSRASFLFPMFLGLILPAMRVLREFIFLHGGVFFAAGGFVGAVLLAVILALSREWRRKKVLIFLLAFFCYGYGLSFVGEVNYLFDAGDATVRTAVVEDMRITKGKRWEYRLTLSLPDGTTFDMDVDQKRYESTQPGEEISVLVSDGALGIPYVWND